MKNSICVLVSGGLDSCVLAADLAKRYRQVRTVFVQQGLIWEKAELRALRRFLKAVGLPVPVVLPMPVGKLYRQHWSVTGKGTPSARSADAAVYLPERNSLLLSAAAVFCAQEGIGTIAVGTLAGNPFDDATPKFFREFGRLAGVRVIAPFRKLSKPQVVRRGRNLPLHLTFSCLAPQRGRHCGRCNKCAERRRAFEALGIAGQTRYAAPA
jgi:7-cyano-7-deazaguanine synthase